jgi:hypothetical protein
MDAELHHRPTVQSVPLTRCGRPNEHSLIGRIGYRSAVPWPIGCQQDQSVEVDREVRQRVSQCRVGPVFTRSGDGLGMWVQAVGEGGVAAAGALGADGGGQGAAGAG